MPSVPLYSNTSLSCNPCSRDQALSFGRMSHSSSGAQFGTYRTRSAGMPHLCRVGIKSSVITTTASLKTKRLLVEMNEIVADHSTWQAELFLENLLRCHAVDILDPTDKGNALSGTKPSGLALRHAGRVAGNNQIGAMPVDQPLEQISVTRLLGPTAEQRVLCDLLAQVQRFDGETALFRRGGSQAFRGESPLNRNRHARHDGRAGPESDSAAPEMGGRRSRGSTAT